MRVAELINLVEANLSYKELNKYPGIPKDRIPTFLEKIITGSPFTLIDGSEVVIDQSEYDKVASWLEGGGKDGKLTLTTDDGRVLPLSAFQKTAEFGGEPAGNREIIEQGQIEGIAKELEAAKAGAPFVKLKVGNKTVKAASVGKTEELANGRAPKSDMTVYDENNNPVAWVSLKDLTFRWGGFQHLANQPDIKDWLNRVRRETHGGIFKPGDAFGHHIPDEIANLIVFGKNFGTGQTGISNVDAVLIGWTTVKKSGKQFILSADTVYANGETPKGEHEPYLVIRYMKDRPDLGFQNARAETNTKRETRKVKWLDKDSQITIDKHPNVTKLSGTEFKQTVAQKPLVPQNPMKPKIGEPMGQEPEDYDDGEDDWHE